MTAKLEGLGDLRAGKPQVVIEHEDRPLLAGQPSEGPLELVASGDARLGVFDDLFVIGDQPQARLPAPDVAHLCVARIDEQPVEPGFEPIVVAQPRQLPPRGQERLLDRILG
jgi:hypothetical protein